MERPKEHATYQDLATMWKQKFSHHLLHMTCVNKNPKLKDAINQAMGEIQGIGHLAYLNDKYIKPHIDNKDGPDFIVDDWLVWLKIDPKQCKGQDRKKLHRFLMTLSELFASLNIEFTKKVFTPSQQLESSVEHEE